MNWNNISLKQFIQIQEDMKIEDDTERLIAIANTVFDTDVASLPISTFNEKIKELSFMKESIPNNLHLPKTYKINEREYTIHGLLGEITAAQYIDYTAYLKENDLKKIASCFIIPLSHNYNDGYDMEEVFADISSLPITLVNSLAFFFERQLSLFIRIFHRSLRHQLKKSPMKKEDMLILERLLSSSVSYLTS